MNNRNQVGRYKVFKGPQEFVFQGTKKEVADYLKRSPITVDSFLHGQQFTIGDGYRIEEASPYEMIYQAKKGNQRIFGNWYTLLENIPYCGTSIKGYIGRKNPIGWLVEKKGYYYWENNQWNKKEKEND